MHTPDASSSTAHATFRTIDAHVGGTAVRLVVEGFPSPRGRTMSAKLAWVSRHADELRRALLLEPRGHEDMLGAVLTEPAEPGAHAGVCFMNAAGYCPLSGSGVAAVTTIALERGLLLPGTSQAIVFDTAAGTVRATPRWGAGVSVESAAPLEQRRVVHVDVQSVPAFAVQGGVDVVVGTRRVRADVAYGGAFYAVVDSEAAGLPLDGSHLPELRRAGLAIARAVDDRLTVVHPTYAHIAGIAGTIFIGPAHQPPADLRSVVVDAGGVVRRSASGTGTTAIMAVLDAMGLLDHERDFVNESLVGGRLAARVVARTDVAGTPAIVPAFRASAWITGDHVFTIGADDPLPEGFRL